MLLLLLLLFVSALMFSSVLDKFKAQFVVAVAVVVVVAADVFLDILGRAMEGTANPCTQTHTSVFDWSLADKQINKSTKKAAAIMVWLGGSGGQSAESRLTGR